MCVTSRGGDPGGLCVCLEGLGVGLWCGVSGSLGPRLFGVGVPWMNTLRTEIEALIRCGKLPVAVFVTVVGAGLRLPCHDVS